MKQKQILAAISAGLISLGLVGSADAALVSRLGGMAYYDDVADLTWLADANYAQTSGYDADGLMTWQAANDWAAQLTVGGLSGWRLANPDATCFGQNCTNSEMGNLFYNTLGNPAGSLINTGPFSNVQSHIYWSSTQYAPAPSKAWSFFMADGSQNVIAASVDYYGWAVQSGDVGLLTSAVPVPAAVWLFGSGLLGLAGVARRKSANP